MKPSDSSYLTVRGLRYHVRSWGADASPPVIFLHGWMDNSASFQFVVDALTADRRIIAPDWRGEGLSAWASSGGYTYVDYVADLDALLQALHPQGPADIVGHSRGGNIACLYAGIRPERVRRVVNIEGFGLRRREAQEAPTYYAQWLAGLRETPKIREYADYAELAAQIRRHHPRLDDAKARFLAEHWGRTREDGRVILRSDPALTGPTAMLFRLDEMLACYRNVKAPVLWIEATESTNRQRHAIADDDYAARRGAIANARAAAITDAGHMVHLEQPERLARSIDEFLTAG